MEVEVDVHTYLYSTWQFIDTFLRTLKASRFFYLRRFSCGPGCIESFVRLVFRTEIASLPPSHRSVNTGPHTYIRRYICSDRIAGELLKGRLIMRSVRLSVSGQGIGTSCVHRHSILCKSLLSRLSCRRISS